MTTQHSSNLLTQPNIMIVDDNKNNRFAFESILEELDCQLFEAASGEAALELIIEHEFALVLLDVQMPQMDGFEVAKLLKKNKHTAKTAIIFVTAINKEQQYVRRGLEVGAIDYIFKPVDPVILRSKVSNALEQYKQNKAMEKELATLSLTQHDLSKDNTELTSLAKRDHLTGLYNRLSFKEILENTIKVARKSDILFALMFLDLDDFKPVNDQYGHDIGDALLKLVSHRISDVLRDSGGLSRRNDSGYLARLGGDEFAIILPTLPQAELAGKIAARVIDSLKEPFIINHHQIHVGVSIGIVIAQKNTSNSVKKLCPQADKAMYKAKQRGKHNYCYYTEAMEEAHQDYMVLEASLAKAIQNNEFHLVYQPIYDLKTQKTVAIEVLTRWQHPTLGEILPEKFIAIAENNNLMAELGQWIFNHGIESIASLPKTLRDTLWFCFNLSIKRFYKADFAETVTATINQYQIPATLLEFELKESALDLDDDMRTVLMQQLNSVGIKMSIDDFGTGDLSLKRLQALPLSSLKIDLPLTHSIGNNPEHEKMIISIIDVANTLRLRVIAEGIETETQLKFLQKNGCPYGQGFYFTKPMPFPALEKLLTKDV